MIDSKPCRVEINVATQLLWQHVCRIAYTRLVALDEWSFDAGYNNLETRVVFSRCLDIFTICLGLFTKSACRGSLVNAVSWHVNALR